MEHKYQKSETGQSQLIFSLFFLFLASSAVFAYNATINGSLNQTIPLYNNTTSIEETVQVEIWANTSLTIEINDELIKAMLSMDNGSVIPERSIEFFVDSVSAGPYLTDSNAILFLILILLK